MSSLLMLQLAALLMLHLKKMMNEVNQGCPHHLVMMFVTQFASLVRFRLGPARYHHRTFIQLAVTNVVKVSPCASPAT